MERTTVKIEIPDTPSDDDLPMEIPLVNRPQSLPSMTKSQKLPQNSDRGNKVGSQIP